MKKYLLLIVLMVFSFTIACKKETSEEKIVPFVETKSVVVKSVSKAECEGVISQKGTSQIVACGVCWNKTGGPTILDSITSYDFIEDFKSEITGLQKNTVYYVRAYITTPEDTIYGNEIKFNSLEIIASDPINDVDGNTYKTIKIGDQYWMAENLRVTHYRNGAPIPNVKAEADWAKYSYAGQRCYFNNDSATNAAIFGALYNSYAINDKRKICPEGWHIPSWDEMVTLVNTLEVSLSAPNVLLSEKNWNTILDKNNYSGFDAEPSGYRHYLGSFGDQGNSTAWWLSFAADDLRYFSIELNKQPSITLSKSDDRSGFSIRCIKD